MNQIKTYLMERSRVDPTAKGPVETRQVNKLLLCVEQKNKQQVIKLLRFGVPGLINLAEPKEGLSALHVASMANDLDMVYYLLCLHADPDIQDKKGRTALMLAAERGHVGIVEFLIGNEADVTLMDNDGKGLLFYCIGPTKMHEQCLELAINKNANVNNTSNDGKSVFMAACECAKDCEQLCWQLLESGANPAVADPFTGCTALMAAARTGSVELVRAILQKGADPNVMDHLRLSAIHVATSKGFLEILRIFSAYAANFNLRSILGRTPLHLAAATGDVELCRFLFQRGCNVLQKNWQNLLPSQVAKREGHKAALKELRRAEKAVKAELYPAVSEARLHDWSSEQEAVLRRAFQLASQTDMPVEIISREMFANILQAHHAPIDDESLEEIIEALDHDNNDEIILSEFFAASKFLPNKYAFKCYMKRVQRDRQKSKKPQPLPTYTCPPVAPRHWLKPDYSRDPMSVFREPRKIYIDPNECVRSDDFELLNLAFKQNIPVDIRDRYYKTPLMAACIAGKYRMASFLISKGANVNAVDQLKWTSLHHASSVGHGDIVRLLLNHGAIVDGMTRNNVTPLMMAIESRQLDCVLELVNAGADIEATNKHEQSCLLLAQMYGTKEICEVVENEIALKKKRQEEEKQTARKPQARPAAKQTKTKGELHKPVEKLMVALNPLATHHSITLPYTNYWGIDVETSPELERLMAERKKQFAYEDKLQFDPTPKKTVDKRTKVARNRMSSNSTVCSRQL